MADYDELAAEAGFSKFHIEQLRHYLRRFGNLVLRDAGVVNKPDSHWPTIRMDISEGVCGSCKLGAKNCDVDLDGHCGGLK